MLERIPTFSHKSEHMFFYFATIHEYMEFCSIILI